MCHLPTHRVAPAARVLGVLCGVLLLGGCSGGRVVDPSLAGVAAPNGFTEARYPASGVKLSIPRDWTATSEQAPLVAIISSGPAVIALWRYPGTHPALTGIRTLHAALAALLVAIRAKQPHLTVEATGVSSVDGAGAVIIDAIERVNGRLRRVRSEHVYPDHAELVLDAYAPVAQFARIDHQVFSPVRRSLALIDGGVPRSGGAGTPTRSTAAR